MKISRLINNFNSHSANFLRGLSGRDHFLTLLISLGKRTLYKDKGKYSNYLTNIYGFFFYYIIFYSVKDHIPKGRCHGLLTT